MERYKSTEVWTESILGDKFNDSDLLPPISSRSRNSWTNHLVVEVLFPVSTTLLDEGLEVTRINSNKDRFLNANMPQPQEDIAQTLSDFSKAYESQIRSLNDELVNARNEAAVLKKWIREEVDQENASSNKAPLNSQVEPSASVAQNTHAGQDELVHHIRILSEQLREQLESSEKRLSAKGKDNQQLRDCITKAKYATMKQKEEIAQLKTENQEFRAKYETLQAKLQENQGQGTRPAKPAQRERISDSRSSIATERNQLRIELDRCERQNAALIEMLFQHQLDAETVQKRLESLSGLLEQHPGDFKDVEKLIQAEKLAASKARDLAYELTARNDELEKVQELHKTKIKGLTEKLQHREADVESLRLQLEMYKAQANSFYEMMKKKLYRDDFFKAMNDHYEVMRKDNHTLAKATLQLQEEIQKLRTSLLNSELECKCQETKFALLEQKVAERAPGPAKQIDSLEKSLFMLEMENGTLRKVNRQMKDVLRTPPAGQEDRPEFKAKELARAKMGLEEASRCIKDLRESSEQLREAYERLCEENAKDFLRYDSLIPQLDEAQSKITALKENLAQRDSTDEGIQHWKEIPLLKKEVSKIQDHWLEEVDKTESDLEVASLQNDLLRDLGIRLKARMIQLEEAMTDTQREQTFIKEHGELMIECEALLEEDSSEASIHGEHSPKTHSSDDDESGSLLDAGSSDLDGRKGTASTTHASEKDMTDNRVTTAKGKATRKFPKFRNRKFRIDGSIGENF
ncbi:hypothetical protein MMC14_004084 [Varicellaria rhodocarpa]|nr:hypothetical protein [Varicellaria rhodocarpa]